MNGRVCPTCQCTAHGSMCFTVHCQYCLLLTPDARGVHLRDPVRDSGQGTNGRRARDVALCSLFPTMTQPYEPRDTITYRIVLPQISFSKKCSSTKVKTKYPKGGVFPAAPRGCPQGGGFRLPIGPRSPTTNDPEMPMNSITEMQS